MNQTMVVAAVLGVLILVSAVQAYQLSSLKTKLDDGQMTVKSQTKSVSVAQGGSDSGKKVASLPSSVKDLPQMVGGC